MGDSNFDVDVLLNDRLVTLYPNGLNEALDSEQYRNLENEYSDKGSLPNLMDVYKDSPNSLYEGVNEGSLSIEGEYRDGLFRRIKGVDYGGQGSSFGINLNEKISNIEQQNLKNLIDENYSKGSENLIIKRIGADDLLKGIQEVSPISYLFFHDMNITAIRKTIKYYIHKQMNLKLGSDNLDLRSLVIIMRSIYLQYSQNLNTNDTLAEVKYLNKIVVNNVMTKLESEITGQKEYLDDIKEANKLSIPPANSTDWRKKTFSFTDRNFI